MQPFNRKYPEGITMFLRGLVILTYLTMECPQVWSQFSTRGSNQVVAGTADRKESGLVGAASCAGAGCHGGPRVAIESPSALRGSEYSLWLQRDPHARSWQTICSEASKQILSKLGILRDGKIVQPQAYQNCLACHNTQRDFELDTTPTITEGVGCETCHGPAKPWIDRHFQNEDIKTIAKQELGMADLKSLVSLAKSCTPCHVGSQDRDMNHDVIAAGHPALYFDMAVYFEMYPRHWRDARSPDSNLRSKLWMAGQYAAAQAELELLDGRLSKRLVHSVWPELSNFDCARCHVALDGIPKNRDQLDRHVFTSQSVPPRTWSLSGIQAWAEYASRDREQLNDSLERLSKLLSHPQSESESLVIELRGLRSLLQSSWLENQTDALASWGGDRQKQLASMRLEYSKNVHSWESAAGAYIATWATLTQDHSRDLDVSMQTLRRGLLFPLASQSPMFPRKEDSELPPNLNEWNSSIRTAVNEMLRTR